MYSIEVTETARKQLEKLDKQTNRLIKNWMSKNLYGVVDPRMTGKPLKGEFSGIWRYRVGDYRLLAKIQDDKLIVFIIEVLHRREAYKRKR